ncbi:MAG: response regulator [Lacunisphaera sp.]|nr:response regulator [Lacunisphaera sp.]
MILVVENERLVAADLKMQLERLGYGVSGPVATGEAVLAQVAAHAPDLILMDVMLDGAMDGIAAARALPKHPVIPVVFLTAHSDRPTVQRAGEGAPYGYIIKPFTPAELGIAVEMAFHRVAAEEQLRQAEARSYEAQRLDALAAVTAAGQDEERLRALTRNLMEEQEAERGRLALELHDNVTQPLSAIAFRGEAQARKLRARDAPAKSEQRALLQLIGETAVVAERISRKLRPGVLDLLGLDAALHEISTEFTKRTGVPIKLDCAPLGERLPANIELTLCRSVQEALENVEAHAHAQHVNLRLTKQGKNVELAIGDDGVGFDQDHLPTKSEAARGLGLFGMRERVAAAGGALSVKSAPGQGTTICARILLGG